jgi:TolA-binding protein
LDLSDLRAQNALFQTALAAERAGRSEDAARTYRQLLARAPHGSLAAQARANLAVIANPKR